MSNHRFMRLGLILGIMTLGASGQAVAAGKDDVRVPTGYHELALNIPEIATIKQSVIHTKTELKGGKTTSTSFQYDAFNKVVTGEDSYMVTKTMGPFKFLSSTEFDVLKVPESSPQYQLIKRMLMQSGDLSFTANAALRPTKINDFDKVKTNLTSGLQDIFLANGMPKETADNIVKGMTNLYGSLTAESATSLFLPTDTLMSLPRNVGLTLGDALSEESQIMVPMFNMPLQALNEVELTQWNPAQNHAHVRYDYAPTAASLNQFIREVTPKILTQMNLPAAELAKANKKMATLKDSDIMQLSTHCDFDVAIDTGLITNGKCTKVVKITIGETRTDKTDSWEFSETLVK